MRLFLRLSGVVLFQVAFAGCSNAEPASPSRDTVVTSAEPGGVPTGRSYDPWGCDMPQLIAEALELQERGELLDIRVQRTLWSYAQDNPTDARPWLLLARDSMLREWDGFAVRQYAAAISADARAIEVPFVLEDLLAVARSHASGLEHDEVTALLLDNWGPEVLPRN